MRKREIMDSQYTYPGKEGKVMRLFHDFLLEADKGSLPLAVEQRHVDAKNAEEAIRNVLNSGSLAVGGP